LIQCKFNTDLDQEFEKMLMEFPNFRFNYAHIIDPLEYVKIHVRTLMKSKANLMNLFYRDTLQNFKEIIGSKFLKCIHDDNKKYIYLLYRYMIIEHLFFIVEVDRIIEEDSENPLTTDKTASDVTTQVNTVQTTSVPDKLDEFKQQSTTVRNNNKSFLRVFKSLIL